MNILNHLSVVLKSILHSFTLQAPYMKIVECGNRLDPDEAAHNELPHFDLHCCPLFLNSKYDILWMKLFFLNFAEVSFAVCFCLIP